MSNDKERDIILRPAYYTITEGGVWLDWQDIYGTFYKSDLDKRINPHIPPKNVMLPVIGSVFKTPAFYALAFETPASGHGNFARWDCEDGWTTTIYDAINNFPNGLHARHYDISPSTIINGNKSKEIWVNPRSYTSSDLGGWLDWEEGAFLLSKLKVDKQVPYGLIGGMWVASFAFDTPKDNVDNFALWDFAYGWRTTIEQARKNAPSGFHHLYYDTLPPAINIKTRTFGGIIAEKNKSPALNKAELSIALEAPNALLGLCKVLEYSRTNWKRGLNHIEVVDSLLKHLTLYMNGVDVDIESKLPHVDHVLCNALFLAEMCIPYKELADRQSKDINNDRK